MNVADLLKKAAADGASDLFLIAGLPVTCRIDGRLRQENEEKLLPKDTEGLIAQIYQLAGQRPLEPLAAGGDDDFSFALPGVSRFRVNTYKQRGTLAAVIRVITFSLPKPEELGIPDAVIRLGEITRGLVLVTGPAGSGKSTTQACMVDAINTRDAKHIITLEDPLEYLHSHKKSIVSQREISLDTQSYVAALRAALRQSPDVILLGEMRDAETTSVAMTAAETGHLIISTMHTIGAANTIDRIIDIFPPSQQPQITVQLSMSLMAVVSQQLVPSVDGRRIAVFEVMTVTPAIRNMIRENKIHQISGILYSSATEEMMSMDAGLHRLFAAGRITKETALTYAANPDMLGRRLGDGH